MCICSDVQIIGKLWVSYDVSNMPFGISPLYIFGGELGKSMKFPTDSSFVRLSLYCEFFFGIVKVE